MLIGRWRFFLLVSALVLAGLAIRLAGIDRTTLWFDEVMTVHAASLSVADLIQDRVAANHSPVFFYLMKVLSVPWDSIFLLRLPAALFGAATVAVGVSAARALIGTRAGWMAGLLFAFTPILVDYGQEARPYSPMIFGVVLALWGAALVMRYPRSAAAVAQSLWLRNWRMDLAPLRGAWFFLLSGSIWSVLMLPYTIIFWVALDLSIGWMVLTNGRRYKRLVRPWVVYRIFCIAICLPFISILGTAVDRHAGDFWYVAPNAAEVWQQTAHALLFQFRGDPNTLVGPGGHAVLAVVLTALAVFGVLKLRTRPASVAIILSSCLIPLLILGLISASTPVYLDRYLLIATPAFTLALAAGLAAAWTSPSGRLIASSVLVLCILQLIDLQQGSRRADWRPLLERLSSTPQDIFVVAAHNQQVVEIKFEWVRQRLSGEPPLVTFGDGGHPRADATYLLLREPSVALRLRGLAAMYNREDWEKWLERMGVKDIDFSSATVSGEQIGAEYQPD